MNHCNLNTKMFEDYLDVLLKANLLLMESDNYFFMLMVSSKGKSFLNTYHAIKTMIE